MILGRRLRASLRVVAAAAACAAVAATPATAGVSTYFATEGGGEDRSLVVRFEGGEADEVIARNGIPTQRSPATRVRVTEAGQVFAPDPMWGGTTADCGSALGELICSVDPPLFFWPFLILGSGSDTARLTGVGGGLLEGGGGADVLRGSDGTTAIAGDELTHLGDELYGDSGSDRIVGRAGEDFLSGGSDDDVILAADGYADAVYCWEGTGDRATVDAIDFVVGCEHVTVE